MAYEILRKYNREQLLSIMLGAEGRVETLKEYAGKNAIGIMSDFKAVTALNCSHGMKYSDGTFSINRDDIQDYKINNFVNNMSSSRMRTGSVDDKYPVERLLHGFRKVEFIKEFDYLNVIPVNNGNLTAYFNEDRMNHIGKALTCAARNIEFMEGMVNNLRKQAEWIKKHTDENYELSDNELNRLLTFYQRDNIVNESLAKAKQHHELFLRDNSPLFR